MKSIFVALLLFVCFSVFVEAGEQPVLRPVRMELSTKKLGLGDVLRLDVFTTRPIKKQRLTFVNNKFTVFLMPKAPQSRYHYVAFIGAPRTSKSGGYFLQAQFKLSSGFKFHKQVKITLAYPKLKKGKVALSKKKNGLSTNFQKLRVENKLIGNGFSQKTAKLYIEEGFKLPAQGRMTSFFGALRTYNGEYTRSHAGVDIANKIGTSVVAPNKGRVVLSQDLEVHGKTVMIDHGFGVVTIYNHLNERLVKKGQMINKGDALGRVGMTGVATGPHLHWGMSVQNVRVDPLKWVK